MTPPVSLADLAGALDVRAVPDRRVETTLYHVHLPALDDADVLTFDAETATVTGLNEARLDALLDEAETLLDGLHAPDTDVDRSDDAPERQPGDGLTTE